MRWFMKLAYRGASYHGWQSQPNATSVQQTIEEALATVLRTATPIVGAGRTDTGVNARTMWAHFDTAGPLPDTDRLLTALNRLCGKDIAIYGIYPVTDSAHARFDALSREYRYFVTTCRSPFLYQLSWQTASALDFDKMNSAARILTETDDFTSFAKLHSDAKTNICKVTEASWCETSPGIYEFRITADRFLRNMVRAVVGTLIDVGRGRLTEQGFRDIIKAKDRCAAGTSMPPQALFLWDVSYPPEIFV